MAEDALEIVAVGEGGIQSVHQEVIHQHRQIIRPPGTQTAVLAAPVPEGGIGRREVGGLLQLLGPYLGELHHMAVHGRIEHWPHKAFELRHLFKSVVQLQRPDFDDLRIEAEWLGDGLLPRHGLIPLQIQHDIGKLLHTLSPVLVAVLFGCRLFQNLLLSI